jgi:DtxR family Mn-dependent transcriptional regulator
MQMAVSEKLTASLEDYLEAVLFLVRANRVARVRDIAAHVGVGSPAVTAALKTLAKRGLVNYEAYQLITLTPRGRELAERISRRHHALRRFFSDVLGLEPEAAQANACRVEHVMDDDALERLIQFDEFVHHCPRAGDEWLEKFVNARCSGQAGKCSECIEAIARGQEGGR